MLQHRFVCLATLFSATLFLQVADLRAGTITIFTEKAAFEGAISNAGTDTFNDLSGLLADNPLSRIAGPHQYQASVPGDSFYMAGTVKDSWLSTNTWETAIVLDSFAPGIKAIGGYFFPSDSSGEYIAGSMTLTLQDKDGATETTTFAPADIATFRGFISTSDLASLTVTPFVGSQTWATANDLILGETLGDTQAVPEPGSLMIMSGLGLSLAAGALARKRRRQTCPVGKGA